MNRKEIISAYFHGLGVMELTPDQVLLNGGGACVLYDLQEETSNIDVDVTPEVFRFLEQRAFKQKMVRGKVVIAVTENINVYPKTPDNVFLTRPKIVDGVYVQHELEVASMKQMINRPQDKELISRLRDICRGYFIPHMSEEIERMAQKARAPQLSPEPPLVFFENGFEKPPFFFHKGEMAISRIKEFQKNCAGVSIVPRENTEYNHVSFPGHSFATVSPWSLAYNQKEDTGFHLFRARLPVPYHEATFKKCFDLILSKLQEVLKSNITYSSEATEPSFQKFIKHAIDKTAELVFEKKTNKLESLCVKLFLMSELNSVYMYALVFYAYGKAFSVYFIVDRSEEVVFF